MLILTRRTGESIIINSDIKIIVLSADPNHVKLGFEAPENVNIVREELLDTENPTLSNLHQWLHEG